jgi:hypothetical protein
MALPATDGRALFDRGALGVELGPEDMPPFVAVPELKPEFLKTSLRQFEGLEDAADVLVNSFSDIEPKVSYFKHLSACRSSSHSVDMQTLNYLPNIKAEIEFQQLNLHI